MKLDSKTFQVEAFKSHRFLHPFIFAGVICLALYTFFQPIQESLKAGNGIMATAYIVFFLFLAVVAWLSKPPPPPQPAPKGRFFSGPAKQTEETYWDRNALRDTICDRIRKADRKDAIVVGASGSGKTLLLEREVIPLLQHEGWKVVLFERYGQFRARLVDQLKAQFLDLAQDSLINQAKLSGVDEKKFILILDQFEQFLADEADRPYGKLTGIQWLQKLLESSLSYPNIRHLIVIRKEWYYDLRSLGNFVPSPQKVMQVTGIVPRDTDTAFSRLSSNLSAVAEDDSLAADILASLVRNGEILPVEVQTVGLMLEHKRPLTEKLSRKYFFEDLGGKQGLVQSFFDAYLKASSNKDTAAQVMFALSTETKLRRQLGLRDLASVTHKPIEEVRACVSFLADEGLVRSVGHDVYEMAHDYYAEQFHEFSGAELNPEVRDNILFFTHRIQDQHPTPKITHPEPRGKLIFSDYVALFLGLLLTIRLLGPTCGVTWAWFNHLSSLETTSGGVDMFYLPIFISHGAWSIYVALFYRRFLSFLMETPLRKAMSRLVVVSCALSVIAAVFMPSVWLLSISAGGLVVGIKLIELSKRPRMNKISSDFFRLRGSRTIINVSIVGALGATLIYYVHANPISKTVAQNAHVFSVCAAIVMTWYMLSIRTAHVSKEAASTMLGLIDRADAGED
jgi:Novel STAND NTPase 1